MKVSAGVFIVNAIVNIINFFNYEIIYSSSISWLYYITNAVAVAVFLGVLIMMYNLQTEKDGKLILGVVLLLVYIIGFGIYFYSPSLGVFIDLFIIGVIFLIKGIAYVVVNKGFQNMNRQIDSPIIWVYGFTKFVMLIVFIISAFIFWLFADIAYYVTDWLDALLLMGFAGTLFKNSNNITKPARPPATHAPSTYAPPASTQPSYSTYQTPVQQQPFQPVQSEDPTRTTSFCMSCGSTLEVGEKFCTNCGAKVE